jgi:hypothetical protein
MTIFERPNIDPIELYTLYQLQCIAMENHIQYDDLTKAQLFNQLKSLNLLPY